MPIEIEMNGLPNIEHVRSTSLAGLSVVNLIFDDSSNNDWDRQKVLERLSMVTLPPGVSPQIGPDYSPVGQIYWYTLTSTNPSYDLMALKSLQDWTVAKYLRSVPDVVDDSSFGGITREYQVQVDPNKLVDYGLSLAQLEQQLTNGNGNTGGSFIEEGGQQINVRGIGLVTDTRNIGTIALKWSNGTPVYVNDVARVVQGPEIRLGQIGNAIHRSDGVVMDNDDVVEGIVFLRKGANAAEVLKGVHAMVDKLNNGMLPPGVKIVPYLDRSDLMQYTTHTVLRNLAMGMALVVVILFLFLGNARGAIIVALTIPFSLLFASICLDVRHISANLLSLGALDFGMVVDGAVVMVENIVRRLNRDEPDTRPLLERIRAAAHEVQRPVFYAIAIIISAYLPLFALQEAEGKLFKPMAWTVAYALLGALFFSMLVAPALSTLFFARGARQWRNPAMDFLRTHYRRGVRWTIHHRGWTLAGALTVAAVSAYLAFGGVIGSEFMPHLDEGALWVRGSMAPSTGPTGGVAITDRAREILTSFPEVPEVVSQVGRPDDGTDTTGFFNAEFYVDLKPPSQWRPVFHQDKDELIAAMTRALGTIPGVTWGFSQPIADNLEEAVSGVKGELAVKIYGSDLRQLESLATQTANMMKNVHGVQDLGIFHIVGQPNLQYSVNREAAARYGINMSDVEDAIQTAVGDNPLTQVLLGEERYNLVLRYQPQYRDTPGAIAGIRLLAPTGERVSLAQLTNITTSDGGSEIYRENNSRYIAVKYSVRDRDLGSTVQEAMSRVAAAIKLPQGYSFDWSGEYQSEVRARKRLDIVLPVTVAVIFLILYTMFGSFKWTLLVLTNLVLVPLGGLIALILTHTNFSVSSGVGFIALFGVSVQTGVIMLEYINQLRARGYAVDEAAEEGAVLRLRPIMMTMLVAALGLLPAALSHDIGSDSQRPFAIVIVGGLISGLCLSIFLMPTLYAWIARPGDRLPEAEPDEAV